MTLVGTVFLGTLMTQFNDWGNHIRLFYISLYIVRTHFCLEYIKAFTTLINDVLASLPFPPDQYSFSLLRALGCYGTVTSAWSYDSWALLWFSHSASGALFQTLSRESLVDSVGSAAHACSVRSDLTAQAHAGHVAVFPQVPERVGSSQGPSRSRWYTEIGKTVEAFTKKMFY